MVFIRDLKREFFEFIAKQQRRLLVFVHLDVDSLCAWKIFQHLLQCEHIAYTCLPVLYKYDLENGHIQHSQSGIKSIVLINCGSTLDLYEFLSLDSLTNNDMDENEDNLLTLFVLDSLRSIEHRNVYDAKQIRLIVLPEKIESEKRRVPQYEELFHETYDADENNEDDDEMNSDDDGDETSARIESVEGRARRLKRQWLKKRDAALANYYKYRTHSYSSALIMFELAYLLSKDTNDQLWCAIIGVTEQLLHGRIDRDFYMEQLNLLQTHVLRLNHHHLQQHNHNRTLLDDNPTTTGSKLSMDCMSIKFDDDIHFHLLRHWSLYESICHTHDLILAFKLWSSRGNSQLKEFLADLGIPKREYEQNYRDMNIKYKINLKKQILDKRLQDKYHYTTNTLIIPTFLVTSGFSLKLCPQDMVYATMATLQTSSSTSSSMMIDLTERFSLSLACLNYQNTDAYMHGIDLEKIYLKKIQYLMETLLQSDKNLSFDHTIPFILLKFDQNMFNSSTDSSTTAPSSWCFFTHPNQAYLFARNALQMLIAYVSSVSIKKKKSANLKRLPLVLIAPYSLSNVNAEHQELIQIVVGVPALNGTIGNSFSAIFEAADRRCGHVAKFVFFDHSVLLIQEQHQQKFVDALMFVLAK